MRDRIEGQKERICEDALLILLVDERGLEAELEFDSLIPSFNEAA